MNLLNLIKTVGTGIIRDVVPGGGLIVGAINELLPDDKKLTNNATGLDINSAIELLPQDQRAALLDKEFDVDITQIKESNATVRAMLEADTKNPHTTRPYIAKHAFHVVAGISIIVMLIWADAVIDDNEKVIKTIMDGWPFVTAVIAPFVTLLWAYFGVLKQEHKNKLDAAGGASSPSGVIGLLSSIIKR